MPNQNSNQTQNIIEVIMTEEEANKYLNSFKEKMGYKDISLILKSEAPNNNDDNDKSNEESKEEIKRLKTIRNKLIEGIRIGIIFFDEENKVGGMSACRTSRACRPTAVCHSEAEEVKGITQKLLYPFEYNGNKVEELCFFKKLKLKDIKNISQGKEAEILIKNIATMTNEKVEKIEELDTNDFDYTSSIYAFLQKK